MVSKFRPLDGDPVVRVVVACVLANKFSRPSSLAILGEHAGEVVALLTAWRFAVTPTSAREIKSALARVRRVVVIPSASTISEPQMRAMITAQAPLFTAAANDRHLPAATLAYRWSARSLEPEAIAERERHADPAGKAIARFLDSAFRSIDAAGVIDVPSELAHETDASDQLTKWLTGDQVSTDPRLPILLRMLSFVAGKRAATIHEARIAQSVATARLTARHRQTLERLLSTDGYRVAGETQAENQAERKALALFEDVGAVTAERRHGAATWYRATDELRELARLALG